MVKMFPEELNEVEDTFFNRLNELLEPFGIIAKLSGDQPLLQLIQLFYAILVIWTSKDQATQDQIFELVTRLADDPEEEKP